MLGIGCAGASKKASGNDRALRHSGNDGGADAAHRQEIEEWKLARHER